MEKSSLAHLVLCNSVSIAEKENTRRTPETGPAPKEEEGMKKVLMAVIAVALVAMAGTAMAAPPFDTTVSVNATVTGNCRFLTGGSLAFTLDPALGGLASGTVTQPTFWCTRGTIYTIVDDDGLNASGGTHRMQLGATGEFIPYTFTYLAGGTGQGRNTTLTMDIASTIAEADYINATAGIYSDTVTLTINP